MESTNTSHTWIDIVHANHTRRIDFNGDSTVKKPASLLGSLKSTGSMGHFLKSNLRHNCLVNCKLREKLTIALLPGAKTGFKRAQSVERPSKVSGATLQLTDVGSNSKRDESLERHVISSLSYYATA